MKSMCGKSRVKVGGESTHTYSRELGESLKSLFKLEVTLIMCVPKCAKVLNLKSCNNVFIRNILTLYEKPIISSNFKV